MLTQRHIILLLPLAVYACIAASMLDTYIKWQSVNFVLGAIAIPFVSTIRRGEHSLRYAIPTLLFAALAMLLPVYTLLYFALIFGSLLIIESLYGRADAVLLVLLFFLCPFFQYSINVFSFPIRLELTTWAGDIMDLLGMENTVNGNIIVHNNNSFSIDAECMGLNMLVMSLVLGISILAWNNRKLGKETNLWILLLFLAIVLAFNIAANLFRIITMVLFVILPGTMMHELVGILFLIFYVITPSWFLSKLFAKKFGKSRDVQASATGSQRRMAVNLLAFVMVLCCSFKINANDKNAVSVKAVNVEGFQSEVLTGQVIKLQNDSLLIYLKKIDAFYSSDHTPYICWKGSGYEFEKIGKDSINGFSYYTGELVKGKERLHTAWWYESKDHRTTDQLDWRWNMLRNASDCYVVNVSASGKEELRRSITELINNNTFKSIIK